MEPPRSSQPQASTPTTDGSSATSEVPGADEPKFGGVVTVGASTEVNQWDPLQLGGEGAGQDRGYLIYDTLMRISSAGDPVPHLAEDMTTADGGKVWQMKLREGVTFTDGTALDADAVVYNINRMMDPEIAFIHSNDIEPIETVTAIDATTVEFVLDRALPLFPLGFANAPGMMISPTAFEAQGAVDFGQNPVGAGPFMLESWTPGGELVLVRNPDYWDSPRPYLDGITYQIMPNAVTTAQALLSGQIQAGIAQDFRTLFAGVADSPDFWVNGGYTGAQGGQFVLPNASVAPGDDIRVREALALAFDPAVTSDALMGGFWTPEAQEAQLTCPPFFPGSPLCVEGTWPEPDLDRAKQLVAEYVAEGNSPEVTFLGLSNDPTLAEYIQQVLTSIGFDVEVDLVAGPGFTERVYSGDYQIAWYAFPATGVPNPNIYNAMSIAGGNYGRHNDEALQAAMDQGSLGETPEERRDGWREAVKIMNENFYLTFIGVFPNGAVVSNALHPDYDISPGAYIRWGDVWMD